MDELSTAEYVLYRMLMTVFGGNHPFTVMAELVMLFPTIRIVQRGIDPDWGEPKPFTVIVEPARNCEPLIVTPQEVSAVLKLGRFTVTSTL